MSQTHHVGSVGETAVALDLLKRGFNVLIPQVVSRYDLLVEARDRYFRVQVKTARIDTRDGNLKVTWNQPYSRSEVDIMAVYDPTTTTIYYVPMSEIPEGAKGITLRITPYVYNRKNPTFLADQYTNFPPERMIL